MRRQWMLLGIAFLVAVLAIGAIACGGDDDDGEADPTATEEQVDDSASDVDAADETDDDVVADDPPAGDDDVVVDDPPTGNDDVVANDPPTGNDDVVVDDPPTKDDDVVVDDPPTKSDDDAVVVVTVYENAGILTDESGLTLYTFDNDQPNVSNCTGGCLNAWPAYILPAHGVLAAEVGGGTVSVAARQDDGRQQVTYNGRPLYYFAGDSSPGDTNGDGSGGVWHVVTP